MSFAHDYLNNVELRHKLHVDPAATVKTLPTPVLIQLAADTVGAANVNVVAIHEAAKAELPTRF